MLEAIETNIATWVDVENACDACNTCHIGQAEDGTFICTGTKNSYSIRHSYDFTGTLSETKISVDEWVPFQVPPHCTNDCIFGEFSDDQKEPISSKTKRKKKLPNGETASRRSYNGISANNHLVWKALSHQGQCKGKNKHVHLHGASQEIYFQMLRVLTMACAHTKTFSQKKYVKRMLPHFAAKSAKAETVTSLARIVTQPQLEEFFSVVGICFGEAHTKPVPTQSKLKKAKDEGKPMSDTAHTMEHDEMRMLNCEINNPLTGSVHADLELCQGIVEKDNDEKLYLLNKRLCPCSGLDAMHQASEAGVTDLHPNVKFDTFRGNDKAVLCAMNQANNLPPPTSVPSNPLPPTKPNRKVRKGQMAERKRRFEDASSEVKAKGQDLATKRIKFVDVASLDTDDDTVCSASEESHWESVDACKMKASDA